MANLEYTTIQSLEELFDMRSGIVIDFSNNSLQRFIKGIIDIDIYNDDGYKEYCSKANKLRQIFEMESNSKVVQLIIALLNYCEDYKLKNNELTDYDKKKINDIRKDIEELRKQDDCKVIIDEEVDKLIQKISTRNAQLNEMALDEKLKELCNLIEYLLKRDEKFIKLNYDYISLGFIKDSDIKELRNKVQCFRHSSQESINERNAYTKKQKQFMVEYGVVICNLIYNKLKND
ncbi:MAG: hypothetical protein ACLSV2_01890 [Clostridium sp.]